MDNFALQFEQYYRPVANYSEKRTEQTETHTQDRGFIDEIISGQLTAKSSIIQELYKLIEDREEIKIKNVESIQSYQLNWESMILNKQRSSTIYGVIDDAPLDEKVIELQDQMRKEEVAFWRDVSELKLRLVEAIEEYKDTKRKNIILTDI